VPYNSLPANGFKTLPGSLDEDILACIIAIAGFFIFYANTF